MSRSKSNRGRFFGRRRAKLVEMPVASEDESQAWDPSRSLEDWLAYIDLVRAEREQLEDSR
jgi:hypothetical protein